MHLVIDPQKLTGAQAAVPQHTVLFVNGGGYLCNYKHYEHEQVSGL